MWVKAASLDRYVSLTPATLLGVGQSGGNWHVAVGTSTASYSTTFGTLLAPAFASEQDALDALDKLVRLLGVAEL